MVKTVSIRFAYDTTSSDRADRKAMHKEEELREIIKCAGIQFDPEVVKVFLEIA